MKDTSKNSSDVQEAAVQPTQHETKLTWQAPIAQVEGIEITQSGGNYNPANGDGGSSCFS